MADDTTRKLPHIFLPGQGKLGGYTAHKPGGGGGADLPERDRLQHADQLTKALTAAVQAGERLIAGRDSAIAGGLSGFYLEFELPQDQAGIIDKLEKQGGKFPITLSSVRPLEGEKIAATVFVPEKQRDYYLKKITAYRDENRPLNQNTAVRLTERSKL